MTTATAERAEANTARRTWTAIGLVLIVLSVVRAGLNPADLINTRGWPQVQAFASAAFRPKLSDGLFSLAVRETAVTLAYALAGTALAVAIGIVGGVAITERLWAPLAGANTTPGRGPLLGRGGWAVGRFLFAVPRSIHEVVFALILVNILGLNPLVAVLAIGIPFGAVTAKVFSELLDDVPRDAELVLRAAGTGRVAAILIATFPQALKDLLSYAFYRFECGIRSAAILGIVGAGGLGFQLALSFQSLRYEEMWTFLWALIIVSALADRWSTAVRRRHNSAAVEMRIAGKDRDPTPRPDPFLRASAIVCGLAVPLSLWWLAVDITTLWDERARRLAGELVADAFPPRIGRGGFGELLADAADTVALAVLTIALAWTIASLLAFPASRPPQRNTSAAGAVRSLAGLATRFVLLVSRSVPPPVWAVIVVFVLFPGLWPGAVALAIYNAGVLGRLQAEVVENTDRTQERILRASGAGPASALAVATVPSVANRFVGLGLYRWEVAVRETVVVGVVGAAGLGRRLDEQTSSFDYQGIVATLIALIGVTVIVDLASGSIRRSIQ